MARRSKSAAAIDEEPIEATAETESEPKSDEAVSGAVKAIRPARTLVTVKFVGKERAVLGNELILEGETRSGVSIAILERASKAHPGEFIIID